MRHFPFTTVWVSVKSSFSPSHQERLQILCVFLFWVEIGVYFISVDGDWCLSTCHMDHWLSIKIMGLCSTRFRPSSPCPSLSWNGTWGCSQSPNILPHADIPAYQSCPWPINLGMETHKGGWGKQREDGVILYEFYIQPRVVIPEIYRINHLEDF